MVSFCSWLRILVACYSHYTQPGSFFPSFSLTFFHSSELVCFQAGVFCFYRVYQTRASGFKNGDFVAF